jgi:hypothetical protein
MNFLRSSVVMCCDLDGAYHATSVLTSQIDLPIQSDAGPPLAKGGLAMAKLIGLNGRRGSTRPFDS